MDTRDYRVLVVTGFMSPNYGTGLQSIALCKFLEYKGCHVQILGTFKYLMFFVRHPDVGFVRLRDRLDIKSRRIAREFGDAVPYRISESRKSRLATYVVDNFHVANIENAADFRSIVDNNTILVVGSDILWQPKMMGCPGRWFLDMFYYTNLHRFSYATSIGANELPKRYYPLYRKYLSKFDAIGVREKKAADLLEPIVGRRAVRVIDPTLLHSVDLWDKFLRRAELPEGIKPGSYVFCYFVMDDQRYWDYVASVSAETGLEVVVLPMHGRDEEQPYTIIDDGTPYEFVWLVKNAAFVVTDSFHACAFSLNYEKEFYLLRRMRRDEDAKYDDFLERYGLSGRVVTDENNFVRHKDIDWATARTRLAEDRAFAYKFIDEALAAGREYPWAHGTRTSEMSKYLSL